MLTEDEESIYGNQWVRTYLFKQSSDNETYSSCSGRNLKKEELESSGVLWYYDEGLFQLVFVWVYS